MADRPFQFFFYYYDNDVNFGRKLALLVEQKQKEESTPNKKKTLRSIADDLHISYQSLLNYQNGKIPKPEVLEKMSKYFGTDCMQFISALKPNKTKDTEDIALSEKALLNARIYSKSKLAEDRENMQVINNLLEDRELLDSVKRLFYNIKK